MGFDMLAAKVRDLCTMVMSLPLDGSYCMLGILGHLRPSMVLLDLILYDENYVFVYFVHLSFEFFFSCTKRENDGKLLLMMT